MSASRGSADKHAADEEFLIAVGRPERPWGTVEEHSLNSGAKDLVKRTSKEVQADWNRVITQASQLVSAARTAVDGYELDEVTFELGFTGTGRIAFVASAEIATSISVTFKKRRSTRARRHGGPLQGEVAVDPLVDVGGLEPR
jgi:hypothetical protein